MLWRLSRSYLNSRIGIDMTIAFIFARGGSKSIPDKNLAKVAGKSLLQRAVEVAKDVRSVTDVVVSSDSDRIGATARKYGAFFLKRPDHLASDDSPEMGAWQHALMAYESELFLSIPTTTPLKTSSDVEKIIDHFQSGRFDLVMGCSESLRSPYLNIFEIDEKTDLAHVVKDIGVYRRQDVPKTYDVSTVAYCATRDYVLSGGEIKNPRIGLVPLERSVTLDIDDPYDLNLANLILRSRDE